MNLIGHKKIIDSLTALHTRGGLAHGYLFYGPSMVGKRATAQAFARLLERGDAPILEHETLQDVKAIDFASVKALDPDVKDSIGIDAAREAKHFLWQKPNTSPRRTLIVDDAELLTLEAQNALLKIIEEPPESSLLIIITSDVDRLLPTIVSRLQRIYFGCVAQSEIKKWLLALPPAEGKKAMTAANAEVFADRSRGKPGLAFRLATDKAFRERLDEAAAFLKTSPAARKEFIKKMLASEDFHLRMFLDVLIMSLAWERPSAAHAAFWHKALELYGNTTRFSLNPRLQLTALLA